MSNQELSNIVRTFWYQVEKGMTAKAIELVDYNPYLFTPSNDQLPPLMPNFARYGNDELIRFFYARGFPVNGPRDDCNPIQLAVAHGRPETVRTLLSLGATVSPSEIGQLIVVAVRWSSEVDYRWQMSALTVLIEEGALPIDQAIIDSLRLKRGDATPETTMRLTMFKAFLSDCLDTERLPALIESVNRLASQVSREKSYYPPYPPSWSPRSEASAVNKSSKQETPIDERWSTGDSADTTSAIGSSAEEWKRRARELRQP